MNGPTEPARDAGDLTWRVYTSRLIGADRSLVLHGGGNTSVKTTMIDRYGEDRGVLWIKASGYDLATMGPEGFTALDLAPVLRLGELDRLSDGDMVRELRTARLDPDAATPSIEAIVHALIPYRFVDHTHADAVLTVSNSHDGSSRLREIYGPDILILPYVKPGFDLALQIRDFVRDGRIRECSALVLEHHGVFTFADDARQSYVAMLDTVQVARDYLARIVQPFTPVERSRNPLAAACARRAASRLAGRALISLPGPALSAGQAGRIAALARNGTVTPEHVVHNKPFPAEIDLDRPEEGMNRFAADYRAYFERAHDTGLAMLPPFPHWAIAGDGSTRSFGPNLRRAQVSADVIGATLGALVQADQLGGWQGLAEPDLRSLEYWELEQAKLKRQPADPVLAGRIAVVAGAAVGIGLATARALQARGAVVVGLDVDPLVTRVMDRADFAGRVVDLTDEGATAAALEGVVDAYGGLDILVCNAGIFRSGAQIAALGDGDWDAILSINLTAHRKLLKRAIPFLRLGFNPSVVLVGSRNVPAPGPGAAAYSVSKAGLTQLMRVAALELAPDGIRVNAVHPDAVFDTNLWTPEALAASAARYEMSVEAYKTRNLLKAEITSGDVANAIVALVDGTLRCTTGAQVPVDGGNERVI